MEHLPMETKGRDPKHEYVNTLKLCEEEVSRNLSFIRVVSSQELINLPLFSKLCQNASLIIANLYQSIVLCMVFCITPAN